MTFLEDRDLTDVPRIPEYYAGKTIFMTGGTGFMGKVLLEKLIYSCPDLDRIYLLLRPKKGVKPADRLSTIYASNCFDRLRNERPGVFESKTCYVEGDCSEIGLGLSDEDRSLIISRTHIIYHAAASVRFDDSLKMSLKLNLRGTREVIDLAQQLRHLECFVHVSTSYANINCDPIEEVMYPPHADWREVLEICENIDDHTLNVLTPKYIGALPNTYVFSKQLAEHLVYEQKGKLPVIIIRPSVVVASVNEPVPGWIENFNGPISLVIASGKGILRTIYGDPDVAPDFIPVDVVIRGVVAASWVRGTKQLEPTDDIPIYNTCNGSKCYSVSHKELFTLGKIIIASHPLDDMLWTTGGTFTTNKTVYFTKMLLLHVLPAILVDTLLWIFGRKTMLLKIQRRIYSANLALQLFLTKVWTISNKNYLFLRTKIKEEDNEHFYYVMEDVERYEYCKNAIIGARRYLLKERDEDIPKARAHHKRIALLDQLVQCLFYSYIFWSLIHTDFVRSLFEKYTLNFCSHLYKL
ncbi:fatty acyl-CoA reductase 1 [Bicyclus anynana]|uniref:Fatty acyl-CoA reductase n=1 Tax=Bicyclus anynana TaxID=110368 RepID=A0ABM3LIR3_BICAN|nr:fatty acyl-CoA reductase 1 [Bicyclus anynana]